MPFLAPILSAMMLALVVFPLRQLMERRLHRPTGAALITTLLAMVTIVMPVAVLTVLLMHEAATAVPAVRDWLTAQQGAGPHFTDGRVPAPAARFWDMLSGYAAVLELNMNDLLLEAIQNVGKRATLASASLLRGLVFFLFQIVIFVFALFFSFATDRAALSRVFLTWCRWNAPTRHLCLKASTVRSSLWSVERL
jgi:predicted PurR-regulated permease PerM